MNTLILTIGLPRSGKTTYARQSGYPMVNPDAIRLALHGERFKSEAEPMVCTIARYMVDALFKAGHSIVVLDATNTTRNRRDEWINKRWARCFITMTADKDICMTRANDDKDLDIMPIIEKMHDQFEPAAKDELAEWERPCLMSEFDGERLSKCQPTN